jgi:hypothetical protein
MAMGPSISRPAAPDPSASGSSPRAVTRAVIKMGVSRSAAPVSGEPQRFYKLRVRLN